jgi:hypothetical protein
MFSDREINKIFSWVPYREDWPIDRNQRNDGIEEFYGDLIRNLTENNLFDTEYSERGEMGNYLEFICYPSGWSIYNGNAIIVCVSLCAPIAAYGQISITKKSGFFGRSGLFSPEYTCSISDDRLIEMEKAVKKMLLDHNLQLLDKDFANRLLPQGLAEQLKHENHNEGDRYLHGIFQKFD